MNNVTKLFSVVMMIISSSILEARAQSYVTYNHDEAKMNQITVQEIGAGGLTPAFYYDVFHRSYQRSAGSKNKLTYRSLAGVAGWQQVDDADSVICNMCCTVCVPEFHCTQEIRRHPVRYRCIGCDCLCKCGYSVQRQRCEHHDGCTCCKQSLFHDSSSFMLSAALPLQFESAYLHISDSPKSGRRYCRQTM